MQHFLTFRVPLNFAAIPQSDIKQACEPFGMSLDTWQWQKHAFGLLKKVCAKRAKLRGEQHSFNRQGKFPRALRAPLLIHSPVSLACDGRTLPTRFARNRFERCRCRDCDLPRARCG